MKLWIYNSKLIKLGVVGLIGLSVIAGVRTPIWASTPAIVIEGNLLQFDDEVGMPMVLEGRTYVPIRIMADSLGYQTKWELKSQKITLQNSTTNIELKINNPIAYVNGKEVYIDERNGSPVKSTTAILKNTRTYVPLRFLTEQLGGQVNYKNGITYIEKVVDMNEPITPWEYQKLLGKGMDVDWSKTEQGRLTYDTQSVKDFKEAGISHVRIRIKDPADEKLFIYLDQQIKDCLDNGLIPVIAYQADEFKNDPSEKNIKKVVEWWATVAERYRDVSHLLSFDLLIEATDELNKAPEKLNELYEELVAEIRKTNPTRIIMISPRLRSDAAYLEELKIPSQHNGYLMAEWHFYASGPSKTNNRKLWTTGTEKEKNLIQEKINLALAWQEKTGVPTWVGAWMPSNYNDGNDYSIDEQVVFATYMTEQLTKAGIPFAVNSDTKFYDRENDQWIKEMESVRLSIFK